MPEEEHRRAAPFSGLRGVVWLNAALLRLESAPDAGVGVFWVDFW